MQQLQTQPQETVSTPLPTQTAEETSAAIPAAEQKNEPPPHILRLIKKLGRRSPIRKIAEALREQRQSQDVLTPLLDVFANPSDNLWKERMVAAWALRQVEWNPEQKQKVVHALGTVMERQAGGKRAYRRIERACKRSFRLAWPLSFCGLLGFVIYCSWFYPGIWQYSDPRSLFPLINYDAIPRPLYLILTFLYLHMQTSLGISILLWPFVLPSSLVLDDRRAERVQMEAAVTLGRLQDPLSIAPLAAVMRSGNKHVRQSAEASLRQIVPLLTTEHYGRLGAQTVPNLCSLLTHRREENFVLLVLEALDKIDNGSALPAVERLAQRSPNIAIREAAERTLQTLLMRQQQEQDAQHLLRASQASSPETLLRAATPVAETDPKELLRGTESPVATTSEV